MKCKWEILTTRHACRLRCRWMCQKRPVCSIKETCIYHKREEQKRPYQQETCVTFQTSVNVSKETCILHKKELYTSQKRGTKKTSSPVDMRDISDDVKCVKRDLYTSQKRPVHMPKEGYKRDLITRRHAWHISRRQMCQKRPVYITKENYTRDLQTSKKRPTTETYKRGIQKRPINITKQNYNRDFLTTRNAWRTRNRWMCQK